MSKLFQKYNLKTHQGRGAFLTPLELKEYLDFEVKRVYYLTQPSGETGQHCHYIEKEFFIAVQGTCTAIIDQGQGKEDIVMNAPNSAIYVPNFVWHGFRDFSDDAIILALSSTNYNPDRSDYLEDYEEYLKIRDGKLKSK